MNEEEKNQSKRSGDTVTTSVSVSRKFYNFIEEYDLSPTECFRRGVAVTLYDLGIAMYQSDKNKERHKYVQEFLKRLDKDQEMKYQYKQIRLFEEILKHMKKIKSIINDIEGGIEYE
ncbi:MAG: hypothetical protein ACOCT9_02505 [archaeon]